jgi:hypothetical protein
MVTAGGPSSALGTFGGVVTVAVGGETGTGKATAPTRAGFDSTTFGTVTGRAAGGLLAAVGICVTDGALTGRGGDVVASLGSVVLFFLVLLFAVIRCSFGEWLIFGVDGCCMCAEGKVNLDS